jgi:hypothetical protein
VFTQRGGGLGLNRDSSTGLISRKTRTHARDLFSQRGDDVGLVEIFSLEQQMLTCDLGERICEAIAKVQLCRVPALAEVVKSLSRQVGLLDRDGFDYDANAAKQSITSPGRLQRRIDSQ